MNFEHIRAAMLVGSKWLAEGYVEIEAYNLNKPLKGNYKVAIEVYLLRQNVSLTR